MNLKEKYALNHSKMGTRSLYLNERLFKTYNKIINYSLNKELDGVNIDLGSGDKGFTHYCETIGIKSYPYDYPSFNLEEDTLSHDNDSIDFVTLNAVIEHIENPEHIFQEIKRVLKKDGFVFIRTPNWQIDFKNFYNDPTHIKPYTPISLENSLKLFGFNTIFLEPGLIGKKWFWWNLPNKIKWRIASLISGGTKSILFVGKKQID